MQKLFETQICRNSFPFQNIIYKNNNQSFELKFITTEKNSGYITIYSKK